MGFRKDFVWGAATAAYQIEGAYNRDGKGENIWDAFTHEEGNISDKSTGDTACDHYDRFREDVALMKELGLRAYRFSISWSRLLPEGVGRINQAGIEFYNSLIDELVSNGIEPYITLYHWDLPYALHCRGGWLNDDIADWFAEYAALVARLFGDRVKHFITFNEPEVFTGCGYKSGEHAPGLKLKTRELLHICHNVLRSHGRAVKALRELVPDVKIGFTVATTPPCPAAEKDIEAARSSYFYCGKNHFIFSESFWLDPIVCGKYPDGLVSECADILPSGYASDMELISAPIDFIGVNTYTGRLVEERNGQCCEAPLPHGNTVNSIGWAVLPQALYWAPRFIYERYKLPIVITENGMSAHDTVSLDGRVHDPDRTDFLHRYIRELKRAADDGADIRGYFQWSLLDNFEWANGYAPRFGMVYTDYSKQQRIIKDSACWYRETISVNGENL